MYYSNDDRWGNMDIVAVDFDAAVKKAMELFSLSQADADDFCRETEMRVPDIEHDGEIDMYFRRRLADITTR